MKITFLLLLGISYLHTFGQDFKLNPQDLSVSKYASHIPPDAFEVLHDPTLASNLVKGKAIPSRLSGPDTLLIDSILIWDWDSLSQTWLLYFRFIDIQFSSTNLLEKYTVQYRTGSEWINDFRYTFTYDDQGQVTSELDEGWEGNDWTLHYLRVNTYDDLHNLLSQTFQSWEGDFWQHTGRRVHLYDTANLRLSTVYQNFEGDHFENSSQYLYTYDEEGHLIHELGNVWLDSDWSPFIQVFNTFDHLSNQLFDLVETFDGIEWTNYSQSGFEYDANHNRTYHLQQSWNGVQWENDVQFYYTFDAANNPATDLEQIWNGSEWKTRTTLSYTHDQENYRISYVHNYFRNAGLLASYADSIHYYYPTVTSTAETLAPPDHLIISPNPTKGFLTIENDVDIVSVSVYNATGAHIENLKTHASINQMMLDLTGMIPGLYFLQVKTVSGIYCERVILQ